MKSVSFQDFDAFAESVRGVDCVMTLRNAERRRWSVCETSLVGIDVQHGRLGSGNIVEGRSWPDRYMIYVPLSEGTEYSANARVLEDRSFAILEPGCEFCVSTKVEHDWYTILVPSRMLARDRRTAQPPTASERTTCRVTRANRPLSHHVRTLVGRVLATAADCPQIENGAAARAAAAELLEAASLVVGEPLAHAGKPERRPRLSRSEIIRRSRELLEQSEDEPVLVGDLAAAAGVSERTLRTAFNEYFGVGPVRYLQLRRLHQVHRALAAAEPDEITVSDVLVLYGEWEFGRFATRYRRLFGELPSETLRTT